MNACDTSLQFSCTSLISEKNTSFFLKPVCKTKILMLIRQINPDKSMGPEGIPRKYLKLSALIISTILAKLYNNCIQSSTYPSALKIGRAVPIHKSGTKNACSNYRPISLLSPLTKLFEKCLHERLYAYLEKFKLFTPNQFGFKQKSSTTLAVRELNDNIVENLDEQKNTCAIFLELKKAFDTVNHQILLEKLEKYGIRGLPLQLLNSYLCDRSQYTMVNNTMSKMSIISCGVPQGSTLNQLLFIIYVNDMPKTSKFKTKLFADSTVLTLSDVCEKRLNKQINIEIDKIDQWMKLNKLSLNYTKTKFMIFRPNLKKNPYKFNIEIGNHVLQQVDQVK